MIAILSDIHANLAALEKVLLDLCSSGAIDQLWITGDLVGYGPSVVDCIGRLIEIEERQRVQMVTGNHERMLLIPRIPGEGMISQPEAQAAIYLQRQDLIGSEEGRWLEEQVSRPMGLAKDEMEDELVFDSDGVERKLVLESACNCGRYNCTFAHGALIPRGGYIWPSDRLGTDPRDVARNKGAILNSLKAVSQKYGESGPNCLFIGHSHAASIWYSENNPDSDRVKEVVFKPGDHRSLPNSTSLVNVGSVGAARGDEGFAQYVIFDPADGTVELRHVDYKWQDTYAQLTQWWQERYRQLDWSWPWLRGESPTTILEKLIDKVCLGR